LRPGANAFQKLAIEMISRFLLVGGLATFIHYVILIFLVRVAGINEVIATTLGYSISTIFNYLLSRSFTFRSEVAHGKAFPKFIAVAMVGMAVNGILVWLLVVKLNLHLIFGQMLATTGAMIWNYCANKNWSFGSRV
jgi:putative flippase GtrA